MPTGAPDEIWANLKERVRLSGQDPMLPSLMDHGRLISHGPTEVEVGFHKEVYKSSSKADWQAKPVSGPSSRNSSEERD